jgi:hypothetical protein
LIRFKKIIAICERIFSSEDEYEAKISDNLDRIAVTRDLIKLIEYWETVYSPEERTRIIRSAAATKNSEILKYFWEKRVERYTILESVVATKDPETLRYFWEKVDCQEDRSEILNGVAATKDPETLKYFWDKVNSVEDKYKILDSVAATKDPETLKYFWGRVYSEEEKLKILDGVAATNDPETLKYFWRIVYSEENKSKILNSVAATKDPEFQNWFITNKELTQEQRMTIINAMNPKDIRANDILQKDPTINHRHRSESTINYKYDIFICHASEDKEPFVRQLATALKKINLNVWYDEFSLFLGDSLRRSIDLGLSQSKYGIVVLSQNFFNKEWPQKELDGLAARELETEKVILPIWHGISRHDIQRFSPLLADRMAVSSEKGVDFITKEILKAIRK